jgi:Ni,Fe-hydrogenase III small subunit
MAKKPKAKQRTDSLRRVVKVIDTESGALNGVRMAIKKMFGPLTPAERRDLRAVTKRVVREAERLLRLLATPRKRAASRRSTKRRA